MVSQRNSGPNIAIAPVSRLRLWARQHQPIKASELQGRHPSPAKRGRREEQPSMERRRRRAECWVGFYQKPPSPFRGGTTPRRIELSLRCVYAPDKRTAAIFKLCSAACCRAWIYKAAIWAIAHRLCRLVWKVLHDNVKFVEQGRESDPGRKHQRALKLLRILRGLGYEVDLKPLAATSVVAG